MCGVVQVVRGCRVLFLLPDRFDPDKKRYFPPPLDLLLSWSTLFRSGQTLRNYLGYVQTACILFNAPTQVGRTVCCVGLHAGRAYAGVSRSRSEEGESLGRQGVKLCPKGENVYSRVRHAYTVHGRAVR